MKSNSQFTASLDLGDLGQHDASVMWSGYRAEVQREDDYNTMELSSVSIDLGGVIVDVKRILCEDKRDDLEQLAWEKFPASADGREDHALSRWHDSRAECTA